jgi:hypothetical protein
MTVPTPDPASGDAIPDIAGLLGADAAAALQSAGDSFPWELLITAIKGCDTDRERWVLIRAVEYGLCNQPIFPLCHRDSMTGRWLSPHGKAPAIPSPHPRNSPERRTCKGRCDRPGHGLYDATTNIEVIIGWWGGRYRGANVGGRPIEAWVIVDVDARHGGDVVLTALEHEHGALPATLTQLTGGGGLHLFFRHPPGELSTTRLIEWARRRGLARELPGGKWTAGIDLKSHDGYVVLDPSIHPDTGNPYIMVDAQVAAPPEWLMYLLSAPEPKPKPARTGRGTWWGGTASSSVIAKYNENTSWATVLEPHGWRCVSGNPDAEGAVWLHPAATSSCSATVSDSRLYIYSTNTPFEITTAGDPHGHSRFDALVILDYGGDAVAAARALRIKTGWSP